jgi:hypothetical protein
MMALQSWYQYNSVKCYTRDAHELDRVVAELVDPRQQILGELLVRPNLLLWGRDSDCWHTYYQHRCKRERDGTNHEPRRPLQLEEVWDASS